MHNDGQPCSGGLPRESTMTWWIWQGLQRIGHSHPSPSPRTSLHGQPVPTCPNPPGYQGIFQYQRCSSQLSKSLREELPDTPPWKIGATPGHLPTRCLFILFLRGSCWKRASVDVVQGTVPGTTEAWSFGWEVALSWRNLGNVFIVCVPSMIEGGRLCDVNILIYKELFNLFQRRLETGRRIPKNLDDQNDWWGFTSGALRIGFARCVLKSGIAWTGALGGGLEWLWQRQCPLQESNQIKQFWSMYVHFMGYQQDLVI